MPRKTGYLYDAGVTHAEPSVAPRPAGERGEMGRDHEDSGPSRTLFGSPAATARLRQLWVSASPWFRIASAAWGIAFLATEWRRLTTNIYGHDAHAYWAVNLADPYAVNRVGARDFFPYSPAFAQLVAPLTTLPWEQFYGVWTALNFLALVFLLGPFLAAAAMLFYVPVGVNIATGNIHLFLAVAIVLGFRYPAAWAFVVLTKVTPGIGLLWLLVRGEWRQLAIAVAASAGIAAVSLVVAPDAWVSWIRTLAANAGAPVERPFSPWLAQPLTLRLLAAAGLVIWGATTDRRWTVPVAATLALPIVWHISMSMLVAVVPLVTKNDREDAARVRARWLAPLSDLFRRFNRRSLPA